MNRDVFLGVVIFLIIFLLGLETIASPSDSNNSKPLNEEMTIIIHPLPKGELAKVFYDKELESIPQLEPNSAENSKNDLDKTLQDDFNRKYNNAGNMAHH